MEIPTLSKAVSISPQGSLPPAPPLQRHQEPRWASRQGAEGGGWSFSTPLPGRVLSGPCPKIHSASRRAHDCYSRALGRKGCVTPLRIQGASLSYHQTWNIPQIPPKTTPGSYIPEALITASTDPIVQRLQKGLRNQRNSRRHPPAPPPLRDPEGC